MIVVYKNFMYKLFFNVVLIFLESFVILFYFNVEFYLLLGPKLDLFSNWCTSELS